LVIFEYYQDCAFCWMTLVTPLKHRHYQDQHSYAYQAIEFCRAHHS
jgi:hypothetical protein